MTQQIVGYRLLKIGTGEVVQSWGGTWGQCPGIPNPLTVDDGKGGKLQVCAPALGAPYAGYMLEEWKMDEPPSPVPMEISDRQFFQQAALAGFITEEEALAAVQTGSVPAAMQAIVDGIARMADRFSAQMILSGATTFRRDHPLTSAIGSALGKTDAEIDEFFRAAALL